MRFFEDLTLRSFGLFVSTSMCLATSCDQPDLQSRFQPKLPETRTLTNAEGRELEARVVAREHEHVRLVRLSDNKRFKYAIGNLSKKDQEWARKLAITSPEPEKQKPEPTSFNEAAIEDLEDEVMEAESALSALPPGTIKWRSQLSHLKRLRNRLTRLKYETR